MIILTYVCFVISDYLDFLIIVFNFSSPTVDIGSTYPQPVKIEVGLLDIDDMPDEIRSRPVDPVRVEQFMNFTIFKPSDIKGGYAIVRDAEANSGGYPIKDLADLKIRIENCECLPIYVIAGWHTTQALQYHKRQGHLSGNNYPHI